MNTALAYQLFPDDDDDGLRGGKMGFLEHLDELRVRIIRSCIAVAVGMIVAFAFIDRIVTFVLAPSRRMLPSGTRLIYTEPGEAFGLYIQVALIAGVLLAAPFIMVQVWRFIAPGLYAKEKKLAIPFVPETGVTRLEEHTPGADGTFRFDMTFRNLAYLKRYFNQLDFTQQGIQTQ